MEIDSHKYICIYRYAYNVKSHMSTYLYMCLHLHLRIYIYLYICSSTYLLSVYVYICMSRVPFLCICIMRHRMSTLESTAYHAPNSTPHRNLYLVFESWCMCKKYVCRSVVGCEHVGCTYRVGECKYDVGIG